MSVDARSPRSEATEHRGPLCALVLRLVGPMQAYGGQSVAVDRPTEQAPSKSAMVGLLGAALGIDRANVRELVELDRSFSLVVRVDSAGTALTDYHTVLEVPSLDGASIRKHATITRRTYLTDAAFSVLFVHESEARLEEWHRALRYPRYAPVLGRRACPPSLPLVDKDPTIVRGATWRELLNAVPLAAGGEGARRRGHRAAEATFDVHVDEHLCDGADLEHARRLVGRDRLVGPGSRMYWDRPVRVCPWSFGASEASDVASGDGADGGGFEDHATDIDTTKGFDA